MDSIPSYSSLELNGFRSYERQHCLRTVDIVRNAIQWIIELIASYSKDYFLFKTSIVDGDGLKKINDASCWNISM